MTAVDEGLISDVDGLLQVLQRASRNNIRIEVTAELWPAEDKELVLTITLRGFGRGRRRQVRSFMFDPARVGFPPLQMLAASLTADLDRLGAALP